MKRQINEIVRMRRLAGLITEAEEEQALKEGPAIQTVVKAVQAALAKGSTVEVNGEEVISVVPLAGRFKTSNGGMIKIGDVENVEIDGEPLDLEMPDIDQSSPNFKYTPTDPGDSITGYHGD